METRIMLVNLNGPLDHFPVPPTRTL